MKTHQNITNKFLRERFAQELSEARLGMREYSREEKFWVVFGMDSGYWSLQKWLNLHPFFILNLKA